MKFEIEFTREALRDIKKHKKTGDRQVLTKIDALLNELRAHPQTGTGKPEQLKHYATETYSRRISGRHRMVYRIVEDRVVVLVLSCWGHYES